MANDIAESIVKMANLMEKEDKAHAKEHFLKECRANRYIVRLGTSYLFKIRNDEGIVVREGCAHIHRHAIVYNVRGKLYVNLMKDSCNTDEFLKYFRNGKNQFIDPPIKGVIPIETAEELNEFLGDFRFYLPEESRNLQQVYIAVYGDDEKVIRQGQFCCHELLLRNAECKTIEDIYNIRPILVGKVFDFIKKIIRL